MINTDSLLQYLVYTTFNIAFMGMAGGALFFLYMKDSVLPRYRSAMVVSAVILFIAALNYFYMKGWYAEAINLGISSFPTSYRYVDWILTTPLMLVKFPLLLGLGPRGRPFMYKLIILDLIMIVSGFFGELLIDNSFMHFGLFGVGIICWLFILFLILKATSSLPERFPLIIRQSVRTMTLFIIIGWSIYPIGYVLPTFDLSPDIRELVYNLGDIINKLGLAVAVYIGAMAMTKEEEEFEARLAQE